MRQRLALAAALLGDPAVLILDEPATGLDPAGINWLRQLLRYLARSQGKTVLVSSHLLAEMEHTADDVVIIAHGRLLRQSTLTELTGQVTTNVHVRTPDGERLRSVLATAGLACEGDDPLVVHDSRAADVGHLAHEHGIELHELVEQRTDLEDVFLKLTGEARADWSPR
jgi:ABC-2 type transport system ATP-binding protein